MTQSIIISNKNTSHAGRYTEIHDDQMRRITMKTKRILAALLSAAVCLSLMTGCGKGGSSENSKESGQSVLSDTGSGTSEESRNGENSEKASDEGSETSEKPDTESGIHTLYIRDQEKNEEIKATFFNTMTSASEDITMTKTGEDSNCFYFTCKADTDKYNMVHLTYGDTVSRDVAFNKCVGGWCLWNDELLPCSQDKEPEYSPKYDTKIFQFDGYDVVTYIWKPDNYDASSPEKYSTVYVLDGQTVLSVEIAHDVQCWNVAEAVDSMMSVTDFKSILVAIETNEHRADMLVPDFGEIDSRFQLTSEKRCGAFGDFISDTVIPYVEQNYNVYTDAIHNSISGSSFGGLASFYIAMEHPDKFGTAGVLSASFQLYSEDVWKSYISEKVKNEDQPFLYFYAGRYSGDNGDVASATYNSLIEAGYTKEKLVYDKYEQGTHNIPYWRSIYPEFLEAAFMQKVAALECGVPVDYQDKSIDPAIANMIESTPDDSSISPEDDPRPEEIKYYVFYDNSETKWDTVWAYWWPGGNVPCTNVITKEIYMADWPGFEMERIEGTDIYRIAAPLDAGNIIFNTGVPDSEVMKGALAYQTIDLPYSYSNCSGKIFKIDTSVEPRPEKGYEKTKYKYSAGDWSDFSYPA